jgi:hypothetical protein
MKAWLQNHSPSRFALGLAGLLTLAGGAVGSESTREEPLGSETRLAVPLDYAEVASSYTSWALAIQERTIPFSKEPQFNSGKVVRGSFQCGSGTTNQLAFIWDKADARLHLDLNRNQDLTDDSEGVFTATVPYRGSVSQVFTNVHLPATIPPEHRATLVDLTLYGYGNRLFASVGMRSYWQSQVLLGGQPWQVVLLENPFQLGGAEANSLLVRRWAQRNKPFDPVDGIPFPQRLFVNHHAYHLDRQAVVRNGEANPTLGFTETRPALGHLRINGEFVRSLVLEEGRSVVLLEEPGKIENLPVGQYHVSQVNLQHGSTEARLSRRPGGADKSVLVTTEGTAELTAGGPLTNSVAITRRGRSLALDYQLVGAGGDAYQLGALDRSKPPRFQVRRAGKEIGSGAFEFG